MEILTKFYTLYPAHGLKCDGCNLGKDYYSKGYRSVTSGHFFHEECAKSSLEIHNLYHPQHSLEIKVVEENENVHGNCKLCKGNLPTMYYNCSICDFSIDLICARKKVTSTIENPKTHDHRLSLVPNMIMFTCHLCGLSDDRFPYGCNLCNLSYHKDCAESAPELNYSCHPKHLLKRLTRFPSYINGKCCLCGNKIHILFYHCSICNFSVDADCAKNPPCFTLLHPKAHEHSLILMPQRSFVCNACGIDDDDPNPYVCSQCNFMIHRNCIDIPRIIKINRHHHRISYNNCLDAGDWKCGVCHKDINWTCGAYSCIECPDFAIHFKCATRPGIWDGIELEDVIETTLEVKSYEVIEEGIIKHFSHEIHTLQLKEESGVSDACMLCVACKYPIYSSPFYSCMICDNVILHKTCAYLPRKKTDPFYKTSLTLENESSPFVKNCDVCQNLFQGFYYISDQNKDIYLDVRCGSISEPFIHESHPSHSLYVNYYSNEDKYCNGCGEKASMFLSCEECEFFLDIKCSILPKMVKHKSDKDHFLSLSYGENPNEPYWCEICEEELNQQKWFYSCDLCCITFHIKCTLGDFLWFNLEDKDKLPILYMILNNHITRPICDNCGFRCRFPSILMFFGCILCCLRCFQNMYKDLVDKNIIMQKQM